jgi:hypothetical protein
MGGCIQNLSSTQFFTDELIVSIGQRGENVSIEQDSSLCWGILGTYHRDFMFRLPGTFYMLNSSSSLHWRHESFFVAHKTIIKPSKFLKFVIKFTNSTHNLSLQPT